MKVVLNVGFKGISRNRFLNDYISTEYNNWLCHNRVIVLTFLYTKNLLTWLMLHDL